MIKLSLDIMIALQFDDLKGAWDLEKTSTLFLRFGHT